MSYTLSTRRAAEVLGISEDAARRLEVAYSIADTDESHLLSKPERKTVNFSRRGGKPRVVGVDREPNGRIRRSSKKKISGFGDWRVYFIGADGFNRVKVGYSNNVEKRRLSLETGCPLELRVWKTVSCMSERDARDLEIWFHKKLKARGAHARAEWFNLSPEQVADIVGEYWFEAIGSACVTSERQI
jgi:hypothetical protein